MTNGRFDFGMVKTDHSILAFGGFIDGSRSCLVEEYDATLDIWTERDDYRMLECKSQFGIVSLKGNY